MLLARNKVFVYLNPDKFKVQNKEIIHSGSDITKLIHYYDERPFYEW